MKIGIIGGGITGLALTHYLADRGIDTTTFEATSEVGGVIKSRQVDGHVLEIGPQRMRKTPGITELVEKAGLTDEVLTVNEEQLFIYADGQLSKAPLSKRSFLETDLLSWRGKLRLLTEPLTRPGMPQESVEDLFVRKFGREAYEKVAGPLYGGIYGSDPAEMPAAFALEKLLEREAEIGSFLRAFRKRIGQGEKPPPVSFESGLQQLPQGLYEAYSDRIHLDTPVTAIEQRNESKYTLQTPEKSDEFDHIVLTTPADVTAELLDGIATGTDELESLRYNPLAMVYLRAESSQAGFGYQVGFGEGLHTLGVSWNASMFDRDGVYTVFLGGMHEPELVDATDDTLGEMASQEFETVMGESAEVIDIARWEQGFPAWDHSWWNIEEFDAPPGISLATNYTGRMGIPSRVRETRQIAEELDPD